MKINIKKLILSIIIPLGLGAIVGFITSPSSSYNDMIQPSFAPPSILFPIVWSILYVLMGISNYRIVEIEGKKTEANKIYGIQLFINLIWSFLFFTFKWYFISFLWILLLIVFVSTMIYKFYKIDKFSAYLQIPYLIWICFASVLNLFIFILN